jgi:outer membrane protein assembly factor BamB
MPALSRAFLFLAAPLLCAACSVDEPLGPTLLLGGAPSGAGSWPEWGQTPAHLGAPAQAGQGLSRIIASTTYDPFIEEEKKDGEGDVLLHYQSPLIDGDDVFMLHKSGKFVGCDPTGETPDPVPCGSAMWNEEQWSERRYTWAGDALIEQWSFESDWKPEPDAGSGLWEPVFHPALAGRYVIVPGAGGTVFAVDRTTGQAFTRINPFGSSIDPNTFVAGPLTVDGDGNVYYNAVKLSGGKDPWGTDDVVAAWLVKVNAHGVASKVAFRSLIPGAPDAKAACDFRFLKADLPWPPSPSARPRAFACGSQRPGLNVAPAVAPDGTIYTVSRAHFSAAYGYLVALNPDLSLKWAASLRDGLTDGCGSPTLPPDGTPGGCRQGAIAGVDPATNDAPAGHVNDSSTASPVVAPDGTVLYGALSDYNYSRGHLMHFGEAGNFLNAYDFGWDVTPAIYAHDGTWSVIIKDNHYDAGSYCSDPKFCPITAGGPYDITQLDTGLSPEWRYSNVNQQSCRHSPGGGLICVNDHPNSFEWCINAPAVDTAGVVYANSEDGNLYAISQGGYEASHIFLGESIGAAYTPLAMDGKGRIYTENFGTLFVVGD